MPPIQVSLSWAVLCQIVSFQFLSRSSLHRLAGLPCLFGERVSKWWKARSNGRLWGGWCTIATTSFSRIADYVYDFCPLPGTEVGPFVFVCDVEHTYFHFGLCGRKFVVCFPGSAPYIIAGSTQELYTCLFRQMSMLLLKISRSFAYAAQPAMHDASLNLCILVIFLEAIVLPQEGLYVAFNIFCLHIIHLDWGVVYSHHLCLCDVHLQTHLPTFIG